MIFRDRAEEYFPYQVHFDRPTGNLIISAYELFGDDQMPNERSLACGRWTYLRSGDIITFFFYNANDAVEFKLRFG